MKTKTKKTVKKSPSPRSKTAQPKEGAAKKSARRRKPMPPIIIGEHPNCFAQILRDKKMLDKKKYTLLNMHKAIGVSYPVLIDLKRQKRNNFNDRSLRDIAMFLDVTPLELMKTYVSPPPPADTNE